MKTNKQKLTGLGRRFGRSGHILGALVVIVGLAAGLFTHEVNNRSYAQVAETINSSPVSGVVFRIFVRDGSGAWLDYGTRTTGVSLNTTKNRYRLTIASTPTNYTFKNWAFPANYSFGAITVTNQTVEFDANAYDGRTIYINLNYNPPPATPAPTVSLKANGAAGSLSIKRSSSLALSWSASNASSCAAAGSWSGRKPASGGENRTADTATSGSRTYKLTCSGSGGSASSQVAVSVVAPPAASPPEPQPARLPSSPPPGSVPAPPATTQPTIKNPDPPEQFIAWLDDQGIVQLAWFAPEGEAVSHYQLERSLDGKRWQLLDDEIKSTKFADATTDFNSAYTYRLRALTAAGGNSGYSTITVTTNDFEANVTSADGGHIKHSLLDLDIVFKPASVDQDAACAPVQASDESALPQQGHEILFGPLKVVCKTEDGTTLAELAVPAAVSYKRSEADKQYKNISYFVLRDGSWQTLGSRREKGVDYFELSDSLILVAYGQTNSARGGGKIVAILLVLLLVVAGVLGLRYRRYRQRLTAQYDDYIRKQTGL